MGPNGSSCPEDVLWPVIPQQAGPEGRATPRFAHFIDEQPLCVTDLHCFREEVAALREGLSQLNGEDICRRQQDCGERLVQAFPQVQLQLEAHIAQLRELADRADKVHRDCTISNVVTDSTAIVSGVLTILGLTLTPVTAGASLAMFATGLGLGLAATATKGVTSLAEEMRISNLESEAQVTASGPNNTQTTTEQQKKTIWEWVKQKAKNIVSKGLSLVQKIINGVEEIEKSKFFVYLDNIKRAVTELIFNKSSAQSSRHLKVVLGGVSQALSKGIRISGAVATGVFLLMDVASLVQKSRHLCQGARLESAETLRRRAQELGTMLELLRQVHGSLQTGCACDVRRAGEAPHAVLSAQTDSEGTGLAGGSSDDGLRAVTADGVQRVATCLSLGQAALTPLRLR
ncbi:Apolipoprotein L3 [Galemys pyrenaicus]|uniref:Apolipoprotein L3 n=1 Tax=Galemys pyrenaicus TaxID=202257 RepID=A0A8J6BSV5_GALPY|nr:Apolipoprotein L3 [Galemys pyrenaicus]